MYLPKSLKFIYKLSAKLCINIKKWGTILDDAVIICMEIATFFCLLFAKNVVQFIHSFNKFFRQKINF
jgi:hypothetical protein